MIWEDGERRIVCSDRGMDKKISIVGHGHRMLDKQGAEHMKQ